MLFGNGSMCFLRIVLVNALREQKHKTRFRRYKMNSLRLPLVLSVVAMSFLAGCESATVVANACPPPSYPDTKVAEELENIPFEGYEDFWDWMDQISKQNDQLSVCRDA